MAEVFTTFVAVVLCVFTFRNYSKGTTMSYLTSVYLIPGHADIIGGVRFKFVVLGAIIGSAIVHHINVRKYNVMLRPALFYLCYGVALGALASVVPLITQISFLVKQWIYMFLFGILIWPALKSQKEMNYFLNLFYWALIFSTIMGFIEYALSINLFRQLWGSNTDIMFFEDDRLGLTGRICVASAHPLDWGQCCIVLIGSALILFKQILPLKKQVTLFFLIFCNCVMTGSRSCIFPIMLFIGLYMLMFFKDSLKRHKWKLLMIAMLAFASLSSMNSSVRTSVMAVLMPWNSEASKDAGVGGSSVELREEQLENSLEFVGDRNFGTGMGYGLVHNRKESEGDLFQNAHGLESVVFVTVIEQGAAGLICFFIFYYLLFKFSSNYSNGQVKYVLAILFICYLLSLVMTGIRSSFQLFFTMLTVIARQNYLNRRIEGVKLEKL